MNPRVEKILRLPRYKRILILVGLMALVVAGFVYLLYMPQQAELALVRQETAALEAKLQEGRRIAADLPKFKAEYEKMQEQLKLALTELPDSKEIPTLLSSIATRAKDNGLSVLRFKPGNETPQGFYANVPVELKLSGSFHEFAMFFASVGNMPRIVNISNLTMGNPKQDGRRTELSVDCLATTFRFLEEAVEAPKAAEAKK
ncbi:MAG: type IV pilus inner membrane component PilO [Trichloromonadaceae bacterium]